MEIERKFLVTNDLWRQTASTPILIRQGYLNKDADLAVRIRTKGTGAYITIKSGSKSKGDALVRDEFEYEIPIDDANYILDNLCVQPNINKRRYKIIALDGKQWEVDEFISPQPGLILAEIELSSDEEKFILPEWAGKEVTHDERYSNRNIANATLDE